MTHLTYEIGMFKSEWTHEKRGNKEAKAAARKCGEAAASALRAVEKFDANFQKWCKAMKDSSAESKKL